MPDITISEVDPEELDAVVTAFASFFSEGRLPGTYDPAFCAEYWRRVHADGRSVSLLAKTSEGVMVGVYMGLLAKDMLTGQTSAYECVWYVMPEYKGLGLRLHRRWEKLCLSRGATRFIAGHLCNWRCTDMPKLYEKLGFQPYEVLYVKDVKEDN
jgi:GNAT superfamily N-acetyltransferase